MKEKGTHERCIEQMQRLFTTKLYDQPKVPVDGERLIRIDDLELILKSKKKCRLC